MPEFHGSLCKVSVTTPKHQGSASTNCFKDKTDSNIYCLGDLYRANHPNIRGISSRDAIESAFATTSLLMTQARHASGASKGEAALNHQGPAELFGFHRYCRGVRAKCWVGHTKCKIK